LSARTRTPRIHAIVLAGGAGTRFWPLSRASRPKPLLPAGGGRTLLSETIARARRFAGPERVWMVCGADHARAMRREAGLPAERVLVEPAMRNTAAAVVLAALRVAAEDPEAVLAVLPADHRIPDAAAFADAIRRAARAARDEEVLVTLGVRPTRAETGYGYIRLGAAAAGHEGLHRVARFVEKPDAARARRFLRQGGYLWNAGVFVWRARTLLEEVEACAPALHAALAPLEGAPTRGAKAREALGRAYRRAPALPIDKAVLERSRRVWCLPVDFHWSDVGTWASLAEELGVGPDVTQVMEGDALLCDASGNLVRGHDRPVVLLGVSGLAVIDAGDALLVADLARSGEVREVVDRLRRGKRSDLL
jgi:mannose-1-phosphate guanylyltransferase